ncbi:hypothetical protein KCU81_g8213, partial [Aureobasidium melanogenum]|uniref:Uncharacterized protein n=1 Tax=Aureobasidium melanogenum (strain CBS 110374) TaxID=1043003 RepID=A0A074VZB6_AURM1
MGLLEARQIFNSDRTVNSLMLCLKCGILSKFNQLVDNWKVYIDTCEIDMSLKITSSDVTIEEASQRRDNNELHADRLRDLISVDHESGTSETQDCPETSADSGARAARLDEYEMNAHGYKQDVERQDYFFSHHGPEGHERLTTLDNIDTRLADQSIATPIAYIVTEENFLEEVERDST